MEGPEEQPPPKPTLRIYAAVTVILLICALPVYALVVFFMWTSGYSLAKAAWFGPLLLVAVAAVGAAWDWIRRRAQARRPAHHHY